MVDVCEENDVSLSTGSMGASFACEVPSPSPGIEPAGVRLESDAVLEFIVGILNDCDGRSCR